MCNEKIAIEIHVELFKRNTVLKRTSKQEVEPGVECEVHGSSCKMRKEYSDKVIADSIHILNKCYCFSLSYH